MKNDMHPFRKLNSRRGIYLRIGYIISFSVIILAFQWKTADSESDRYRNTSNDNVFVILDEIPRTVFPENKKLPDSKMDTKMVDLNRVEINQVDNNKKTPEITTTPKDSVDIDPKIKIIFQPPDNDKPTKRTIFRVVEEMPEFIGGTEAMYKWIYKHIKYPQVEWEMRIGGTVHIEFVVSKTGAVEDVKILRGASENLDAESIRVISAMPNWKPGKQGNKKVDVYYNIPINYVP